MVELPLQTEPGELYVVVNDDEAANAWKECRTDNNVAGPVELRQVGILLNDVGLFEIITHE